MIHEYNGKENLKDALRHYGRKGMRKGFHLPGTEWWKSGGSSPRAKSVSTVYKSQEGQREDDLDLEKRRDKAASQLKALGKDQTSEDALLRQYLSPTEYDEAVSENANKKRVDELRNKVYDGINKDWEQKRHDDVVKAEKEKAQSQRWHRNEAEQQAIKQRERVMTDEKAKAEAARRIKLRDEHWKGTVHNIRPQKSAGAIPNIRPGSAWAELAKRRKR